MTSSLIYLSPMHITTDTDRTQQPHDIIPNVQFPSGLPWISYLTVKQQPYQRVRRGVLKKNKKTADAAERCGVLVWTHFSAVRLLSCHWQPGWEGEVFCLRPAGSDLAWSSGRPHLLQTSEQAGLTNAPLRAAFMCPLMRKPPA